MGRSMTYAMTATLGVLLMIAPGSALACKSAGAFKHVGVVTAVDTAALTVTIKDAETGEPITFAATAKQLKDIKAGDEVMIGFTEDKGKLTAVQIHS
jgi:hypothetical protein